MSRRGILTQIAENMALDLDRVRQIAERVAGSSGLEVVEVEVAEQVSTARSGFLSIVPERRRRPIVRTA